MTGTRLINRILAMILTTGLLTAPGVTSGASLSGMVKSSDGNPLEGIAVSARAEGRTVTTTVYTNDKGEYFFPPLDPGHYKVWAQAVGFDPEKREIELANGREGQQTFSLRTLQDFSRQLSGSEWLASLPADSLGDRRMKAVFRGNCAGCHPANFVLLNRFDRDGWVKILDVMAKLSIFGDLPEGAGFDEESGGNSMVAAYRKEMADYLTKVRGPNSVVRYKPHPRPSGESAQIVVTEYDIPPGDDPDGITRHTGAIWSEGAPSAYWGRGTHDITVDPAGKIWFGDSTVRVGARTLGKLDPRTGQVTSYRLNLANGQAAMVNNGIEADAKGHIWLGAGATGGTQTEFKASEGGGTKSRLLRFDPKTEKFEAFPTPDPLPGASGGNQLDSKGKVWVRRGPGGVYYFDPDTGAWEEYKVSMRSEMPYGLTVDANDNAWFSLFGSEQLGFVDRRTGIISLITLSPPLDPLRSELVRSQDRVIALRHGWRSGIIGDRAPLWASGPRRLGADKKGDKVWFPEYYAGRLGSIDINTKKVKTYPLPHPDYLPYDVDVDKNRMVWINFSNSDRVLKFNPFTEQFTEYPLPTLGHESRNIIVDNNTDPPTVWVPYWRIDRIARIQFRTAAAQR